MSSVQVPGVRSLLLPLVCGVSLVAAIAPTVLFAYLHLRVGMTYCGLRSMTNDGTACSLGHTPGAVWALGVGALFLWAFALHQCGRLLR